MSLCAEAARLAAIECLAPTAALAAGAGYPTLAKALVLDSRQVAAEDLLSDRPFTPVVSVYTRSSSFGRRGETADYAALDNKCMLDFVAELAIAASDAEGSYADALVANDGEARLLLGALVAQIRFVLFESDAGWLFRRIAIPENMECETFGVPDLGLRYQRIIARLSCTLADDDFAEEGGLPQPIAVLKAALPAGSYALAQLDALEAAFAPIVRQPLDLITIREGDGLPPVASVDTST